MSWFDDKIRLKTKWDEEVFEDSFVELAGAVMGKRMSSALNDDRMKTKNAIDEILKFYHCKTREVPKSISDMNEVLEYLMRPYGIMRRNVELSKGWYKDAVGAMLATFKDSGKVVALIPDKFSGYVYIDGETGKPVRITGSNEGLFDIDAIAFYKPFPLKKIGISGLIKYIYENITISDLVFYGIVTLVITLIGTWMPRLNKILFSDIIELKSYSALFAIASFMICLLISTTMFSAVQSLMMTRLSTKLDINVEAATMMRILSLPVDFFKKYSSGELASRAGYVNSLVNQLLGVALSTGLTSVFSLIYIGQILEFAPSLVVPSLIVTFITIAFSVITSLVQMKISKDIMLTSSKKNGMSYAMISGIQKIKISGSEKRAFARWARLYSKEAELTYNPPLFLKINPVIMTAITLGATIKLYVLSIHAGISVSEYYAFNTAYAMVSGAFTSLASIAITVANIRPVLEMAKPIMDTAPEITEDKEVVESISGGLEINNVYFRYNEKMPYVLENLSFKIRPGDYVAIVGKTGCGKSTLMRILLGFETPEKGSVYYDGKDLNKLDLKSLRKNIGTVMQNGRLFTGDIYSNIVISAPQLKLDAAWEAAEVAGIADDIKKMPMGMFTLLSEGQGGISGGQKQRLMIARAIAPKPRLLMLDEATSALDNITQKHVSESLDNLNCTRIVIAHRLSTIKNCNRIIVLDNGKVIEDGTYDELINNKGFFAELVERQKLENNSN
ncbi:MAG: ATP-binding cassette domain-containing protein [Lachnospiraceae bacterium]|nr:ATP-binding cassette domain-containing protein [Lachnospiraceae bacterium]